MSGIVFFRTKDLSVIREFYVGRIGMEIWLEQADCVVLKHDNMLLGFCQREEVDTQGMITFYYPSDEEVDGFHSIFKETADGTPRYNEKYDIYHFFCKDPEGRNVEFQRFRSEIASPC